MWLFIVWFVPAILSVLISMSSGAWGAGLGLAFAWVGFCIFKGSFVVQQQGYVVIERLGKFRKVVFRGWHLRVIGVDRIHVESKLLAKQLPLFTDVPGGQEINFKDTTAPIDASIWYQVGNPDDIANERWGEVAEAVKKWTYVYENPEERIDDLADSALRPRFQERSIEEANATRDDIATSAKNEILSEMELFGAYPPKGERFLVIENIKLPKAVVDLRQLALEGEKRAQESENEAGGYWKAIKAIQTNLTVDVDKARSIYETQRGLDTIRDTKPAMTLVGKDLSGILGTINLGTNH